MNWKKLKRSVPPGLALAIGLVLLGGFWYVAEDGSISSSSLARSVVSLFGSSEPVTLLFTGDVMLSRDVGRRIAAHDADYPFELVRDTLAAADLTFGNLESPISTRGTNQGSIYSFRADPVAVDGLQYAGFDVMSIANNHIWDWGLPAITDTISILSAHGIHAIGAGANESDANAPYIAHVRGMAIGYLAYTNLYPSSLAAHGDTGGVSTFDEEKIKSEVASLKGRTDIVVVSLHWGVEYSAQATAEQRRIAHELIDAGADLVIGHHPHVVEEVEQYKNGWIAYSLGNFVFDQPFSAATTHSIIVRATIKGGKVVAFDQLPITINANYQPALDASSRAQ